MLLSIIQDKNYINPVSAEDIHGLFPYKAYLEIIGNSNIGKYIVVVGNKPLSEKEKITNILVYLKDAEASYRDTYNNSSVRKPNGINSFLVRYKVHEKSILDMKNKTVTVFNKIESNKK